MKSLSHTHDPLTIFKPRTATVPPSANQPPRLLLPGFQPPRLSQSQTLSRSSLTLRLLVDQPPRLLQPCTRRQFVITDNIYSSPPISSVGFSLKSVKGTCF
ncbi:hypothetical protein Pyn_09283 [Prunus yedoensis var. nudiflora]|uniref:Uncharacterized protein n=1 Tax=Prunus yedoensis var. nudiflora TaxID=2094558 RepID=A0A314ZFQ3_PRUYE|nr:hypothetical protein Pyn_09283 [Prunus yedoensis var. nudiflora]